MFLYIEEQCQFSVNFLAKITDSIFKIEMIPVKDSQNEQWDMFENAATNSYARSVLEKSKSKDHFIQNDGGSESPITSNEYAH